MVNLFDVFSKGLGNCHIIARRRTTHLLQQSFFISHQIIHPKNERVKLGLKSIHLILFGLLCFSAGVSSAPNFRHVLDLSVFSNGEEDASGKRALFVGDSHTSAYGWGWQDQVCNQTGMKCVNTASPGKKTSWMAWKLDSHADSTFSYCFIYGGGNDIAAGIPNRKILSNFRAMVNHCQRLRIEPIIITGADPKKVISSQAPFWKKYCDEKAKLQQMLLDSLPGVKIIDTREIIAKQDCADFLCHMKLSGQKKIADKVVAEMNFKKT